MSNRTKVLQNCLKELLAPQLAEHFFSFDGKYTFRSINRAQQTVRIIEFQPGIKSMSGKFTINLGIYSPQHFAGPSASTVEEATTGYCQFATRLGCARRIGAFWLRVFGEPDRWWKQILYKPRDIWWDYSEEKYKTSKSVNECAALILDIGLEWLEKKDDLEALQTLQNYNLEKKKV